MKFLLDNSVSAKVAVGLRLFGYDALHLRELGLHAASDETVVAIASEQNRIIVAADVDFGALLATTSVAKPSLILIRRMTGRKSAAQLDLLLSNLPDLEEALSRGAIAVLGEARVRVRPLPIGSQGE